MLSLRLMNTTGIVTEYNPSIFHQSNGVESPDTAWQPKPREKGLINFSHVLIKPIPVNIQYTGSLRPKRRHCLESWQSKSNQKLWTGVETFYDF